MDLTRLAEKRGNRTRTWASVCGQLFGDGAVGDRAVADTDRGGRSATGNDGDGTTVAERTDEDRAPNSR